MTEETITIDKIKTELSLWVCDVDFWQDEVEDSQKTLEVNLQKIDEAPEKKKLEQFQNQIIYYRDELLPQLKHDLVKQQAILENKADDKEMRKQYNELQLRIAAIHEQMKERRRQLDLFIENI